MRNFRMYAFLLCIVMSFSVGARQNNQLELVIFGDSLADTGNFYRLTSFLNLEPAIPPSEGDYRIYWEGRFSNGPVWADYLAADLGLADILEGISPSLDVKNLMSARAVNYAWGAATSRYLSPSPAGLPVPGILGQVNLYKLGLKNKKAPADAIHVLWGGSDDFLLGFTDDPQEVINNIISAAEQLYKLGARRIVVANLPELCLASSITLDQIPSLRCDQLPANPENTLTYEYNAGLQDALTALANTNNKAEFVLVDIYSAAGQLFPGAPTPGPASGCLESLPDDPTPCTQSATGISDQLLGPGAAYQGVLWDVQHPSTWVHAIISQVMLLALQNPL